MFRIERDSAGNELKLMMDEADWYERLKRRLAVPENKMLGDGRIKLSHHEMEKLVEIIERVGRYRREQMKLSRQDIKRANVEDAADLLGDLIDQMKHAEGELRNVAAIEVEDTAPCEGCDEEAPPSAPKTRGWAFNREAGR